MRASFTERRKCCAAGVAAPDPQRARCGPISPGLRMRCGWSCGAQLTGRNTRAQFTIISPAPRMQCDPGYRATLTGRQMRAHFTICPNRICPNRPAASEHADRRGARGTPDIAPGRGRSQAERAARTAAHAKSPAPIPLGGLRRLMLGHASAQKLRVSGMQIVLWICERSSPPLNRPLIRFVGRRGCERRTHSSIAVGAHPHVVNLGGQRNLAPKHSAGNCRSQHFGAGDLVGAVLLEPKQRAYDEAMVNTTTLASALP
jgi:hypothetical protein